MPILSKADLVSVFGFAAVGILAAPFAGMANSDEIFNGFLAGMCFGIALGMVLLAVKLSRQRKEVSNEVQ